MREGDECCRLDSLMILDFRCQRMRTGFRNFVGVRWNLEYGTLGREPIELLLELWPGDLNALRGTQLPQKLRCREWVRGQPQREKDRPTERVLPPVRVRQLDTTDQRHQLGRQRLW